MCVCVCVCDFPKYPGRGLLIIVVFVRCRPLAELRYAARGCTRLWDGGAGPIALVLCTAQRRLVQAGHASAFVLHLTRSSTLRPPFAVPCLSRQPCVWVCFRKDLANLLLPWPDEFVSVTSALPTRAVSPSLPLCDCVLMSLVSHTVCVWGGHILALTMLVV